MPIVPALEPQIPTIGGNLGILLAGAFIALLLIPAIARICMGLLYCVSEWAAITVLVFLRKDMGVRTVTGKSLVVGLLFLYFIGNVVGHNFHDVYRDKSATIWGAQVHLTYLVLFLGMGVFRAVQARYVRATVADGTWGTPSRFAALLPTHSQAAPRSDFYRDVVRDPLVVISVGLLLALALHNWFGWYLVIVGCLLFYMLLCVSRCANSMSDFWGGGSG